MHKLEQDQWYAIGSKSINVQEKTIVCKWKQKCTSKHENQNKKKKHNLQITNPSKQNKKPKLELKITQNTKQLIYKKILKKEEHLKIEKNRRII